MTWNEKKFKYFPVSPERVILLNTIPLSEERFAKEIKKSFFRPFDAQSDFLRGQFHPQTTWTTYSEYIAMPILCNLSIMKSDSRAVIDYDVTYAQFKSAVTSGMFDVILLVAHHIEKTNSVEFKGSAVAFSVISKFLEPILIERDIHLMFFVCKSGKVEQLKSGEYKSNGLLGFSCYYIEVVPCYHFIRQLICRLDGTTTVPQAYGKAIDDVKN